MQLESSDPLSPQGLSRTHCMGQGGELQGPPVPQALIFQAWLTDFGDLVQVAHPRSPGDFCTNMRHRLWRWGELSARTVVWGGP